MKRFPVFNFGVPVPVKISKARFVHSRLVANAATFPNKPVSDADFLARIDALELAQAETVYGGKEKTAIRNAEEELFDEVVRQLRDYVKVVAKGDPIIILRSGFDLNRIGSEAPPTPPTVIRTLRAGILPGTARLRFYSFQYALKYEAQYRVVNPDGTTGPWQPAGSSRNSLIELTGLPSITRIEVHGRIYGPKGWGPYGTAGFVVIN